MASTKISGGDWYVNPTGLTNALGMANAGLFRDFYHYAFEGVWPGSGPIAEAENFLRSLPRLSATDTVSLDIEEGNGPLADWAATWLDYVSTELGFDACLYSSRGFMDAHFMTGDPRLAKYPLWLAAWRAKLPEAPPAWDVIAFWQFSSSGRVAGIDGNVDMDYFNGTADQRRKYGKPMSVQIPPTPPSKPALSPPEVGQGILSMMLVDNTGPMCDSVWLPFARTGSADIEWAIGLNHVQYFYDIAGKVGWRVRPDVG
jgi:hypothetical protein